MSVECVIKNAAKTVGEGPHWDDVTNTLLYVDIYDNAIHRFNPETNADDKIVLGKGLNLVYDPGDDLIFFLFMYVKFIYYLIWFFLMVWWHIPVPYMTDKLCQHINIIMSTCDLIPCQYTCNYGAC